MANETSAGVIVYHLEQHKVYFLLLHYEAGHWDFPKGHVEKDETLEQTALRETKEETGIVVELHPGFKEHFSYFYRSKNGVVMNKTVYFFIGESKTKQVTLSNEHIGYAWLSYDNALAKLTYDNAKEVLKKTYEFLMQKRLGEF